MTKQAMLDRGDIFYTHTAPSTLKALGKVYQSALCFVTGDGLKLIIVIFVRV